MILDAIPRSHDGAQSLQRLSGTHNLAKTPLSSNDEIQIPRKGGQPDSSTITQALARTDDSDHGACYSTGGDDWLAKQVKANY